MSTKIAYKYSMAK